MRDVIGHFLRRILNISKYWKSTLFLQLWLNATFSSSIHLTPFFFHNDLEYVNFMPSFMCKVVKWMEVSLKIQKIIGHLMIFCQLQQFITLSIFRYFECFKFQNFIQEIYFMPYILVKRKFHVECHVWMQDIIGHFWRKT